MTSYIYTALTSQTTVQPNATIPLGSARQQFGNCVKLYGNGINICKGKYKATASATIEGNGAITVSLYKDGLAVPGATATASVATGSSISLPIVGVVSNCCEPATLSYVVSGVAATVDNFSVVVERM